MSKEKKFRQLIEQQHQEDKARLWERIRAREAELRAEREAETPVAAAQPVERKKPFAWKKWTAAVASLLVVAVGAVLLVKFLPKATEEPTDRYFTNESYEIVETETTLKEYAAETGKPLLYFDWYDETEYCKDNVYQLKDTREIICYWEDIADVSTGCLVTMYVTDDKTDLDILLLDEKFDSTATVNDIQIEWKSGEERAYASFEYNGYDYYLRLEEPINEGHILTLVEELLP